MITWLPDIIDDLSSYIVLFSILATMADGKDLVVIERTVGDVSSKVTVHLHGKIMSSDITQTHPCNIIQLLTIEAVDMM